MKSSGHLIILTFLLGVGASDASAELRLAGIFADHLVLERIEADLQR